MSSVKPRLVIKMPFEQLTVKTRLNINFDNVTNETQESEEGCFPEELYENVESFLESEGIFWNDEPSSASLTSATLKPTLSLALHIKKSLSIGIHGESSPFAEIIKSCDSKTAVPSFLAKRFFTFDGTAE